VRSITTGAAANRVWWSEDPQPTPPASPLAAIRGRSQAHPCPGAALSFSARPRCPGEEARGIGGPRRSPVRFDQGDARRKTQEAGIKGRPDDRNGPGHQLGPVIPSSLAPASSARPNITFMFCTSLAPMHRPLDQMVRSQPRTLSPHRRPASSSTVMRPASLGADHLGESGDVVAHFTKGFGSVVGPRYFSSHAAVARGAAPRVEVRRAEDAPVHREQVRRERHAHRPPPQLRSPEFLCHLRGVAVPDLTVTAWNRPRPRGKSGSFSEGVRPSLPETPDFESTITPLVIDRHQQQAADFNSNAVG